MRKSVGFAFSAAFSAAALTGAVLAPAAASAATQGLAAARITTARNAPSGSDPPTVVTFAVTSGALTMSVPSTAFLGSGLPGQVIDGLLGAVTVTDSRALLNASWTATVSSTSFITGTGTPSETIPAADAAYDPGTLTTTGTVTVIASDITLSGTAQTAVAASAGAGNNTARWNPTIAVTVPVAAVGGTYTGTISHSVS
jgi:hypothetical protein